MKTLPEVYRAPLIGAAVAVAAGVLLGAALKAEVAPESSAGQQLQIAGGGLKDPGAFANWYPAEGAPPPYQAPYQPDMSGMDDVDRQIARLMNETRTPSRPAPQPAFIPAPIPAEIADQDDGYETYLPSRRGDILAPADLPRWAADQAAPPPAEIAPADYEEDAAG